MFSKVCFAAGGNELDAIIAAFATYAVGFVARPLGGIVFGHFGDKFGRKQLLQFSLVLVGAATFLMGCLPTPHATPPIWGDTVRNLVGPWSRWPRRSCAHE